MARAIHEYCDIAGASDGRSDLPCFYAHDSSTCTLIRVRGASTMLDEADAENRMSSIMLALSAQMRSKGHGLTITYERSNNIGEDIEALVTPMLQAAARKQLGMVAVIDETEAILRESIVAERILIAAWTYKDAGLRSELAADRRQREETTGRLPLSRRVQDLNGPYASLQAAHRGFVYSLTAQLASHGFRAEILGDGSDGREDLAEVRRSLLYHETPQNWMPKPAGPVGYPAVKTRHDSDVADLFAATLDRQIMTSGAKASNDLRSINLGGRTYAVMQLSEFPQYLTGFRSLLGNILGSTATQDSMPFRVAFHIEGGAKVPPIRQFLATLGSLFSAANKRIKESFDGIERYIQADNAIFVQMRIYATTWTEPGEDEALLEERRSRLIRALNSWRSPTVVDTAPDPMRLLVETAAGLVAVPRTGRAFIAPAGEAGFPLPLHAESPVEDEGETVFVTMDDKPFPVRAHSPLQSTWFTLIFAPPGAGKSVLLNALNMDFAAFQPSASLPFIGIIDVGESSSGLIDTLRAALPPDRKEEVSFVSMRNELNARDYYANPFDLGLGRRHPLQREKTFTSNFLKAMAAVEDHGIDALVESVIDRLYTSFSDTAVSSRAKIYQTDQDRVVDAALPLLGVEVHDNLTWWNLVDAFAEAKRFDLAERAQRHAMPVLTDVISVLATGESRRKHGDELCRRVQTQIESAIDGFPCFANHTTLDIGSSRVVAIDLKSVIVLNPTSKADQRNNMLMFLMARELFVKKVAGDASDIPNMRLPPDRERQALYTRYWRSRYQEIAQTRKRFCFDEFHITGSSPIMASQIDQDVRQGRKWGLEVVLASQKHEDFAAYEAMASTYYVLKAPEGYEADRLRKTLKVSDAVMDSVNAYVKGPQAHMGAVILIGRRMKGQDSWLLARNRIGPVRLWAFGTELEDRALRSRLYQRTGDIGEALRILAERFPSGTCKSHWRQVQSRADPHDDIADKLVDELLAHHAAMAA